MLHEASEEIGGEARPWFRNEKRIQVLALIVSIAVVVAIILLRGAISDLKLIGYPGVFLFSLLGSGSVLLPLPGLLSVCGASIVLAPVVVGLVGAVGETIGELSGYAIGFGSQGMLRRRRIYVKTREWMERRGTLTLFLAAAIPNPLFDVVGIVAGGTRYPLRRFLVTVLAGKSIKGVTVAYTCFHGFKLLPWVS